MRSTSGSTTCLRFAAALRRAAQRKQGNHECRIGYFLTEKGVKCNGAAATVLTVPNLASAKPGFVDRLIHAAYRLAQPDVPPVGVFPELDHRTATRRPHAGTAP